MRSPLFDPYGYLLNEAKTEEVSEADSFKLVRVRHDGTLDKVIKTGSVDVLNKAAKKMGLQYKEGSKTWKDKKMGDSYMIMKESEELSEARTASQYDAKFALELTKNLNGLSLGGVGSEIKKLYNEIDAKRMQIWDIALGDNSPWAIKGKKVVRDNKKAERLGESEELSEAKAENVAEITSRYASAVRKILDEVSGEDKLVGQIDDAIEKLTRMTKVLAKKAK